MAPVFVVTTHDPQSNQTDTAGGFTDLDEAKQCAVETRNMFLQLTQVGIQSANIQVFIEEWLGGVFQSHRELRTSSDPHAHDEWWVSEAPAFAPIKE